MSPKETQTAMVLLVACVLVGVFGFWRISSMSKPPGGDTQELAMNANVPAPPPPAAPADDETLIDVPTLFASSSADPFRTVFVTPGPAPAPKPKLRRKHPIIRPVDPDFVQRLPEALPGALVTSPPPPKPVQLALKGIIAGGPDGVAIVSADGTQNVVKTGDLLKGGYRVAHIDDYEVRLKKGRETQVLHLGP